MSEAPAKKPHYEIAGIRQVVRSADVWVREMTVLAGQEVPWHRHTQVQDDCYGLVGTTLVETLDDAGAVVRQTLQPGQSCVLPPGRPHRLSCADGERATYLLVQQGRYDFVKVDPPGDTPPSSSLPPPSQADMP